MTEKPEAAETATPTEVADPDAEDQKIWDNLEAAESGQTPEAAPEGEGGQEATGEQQAAPEGDAEPEAKIAPEEEVNIWEDAPEPLLSAYKSEQDRATRLENRAKSADGRVSSLQIRLNDLQKQLDDKPGQAKQGEVSEQATQFFEGDDWKAFKEEYPEVAGPMGAAFKSQLDQISALTDQVAGINTKQGKQDQTAAGQALQDNLNTLAEAHEDWQAVTGSQDFTDWIKDQPSFVQNMAIRNGDDVVDAAEAIDLIQRFKDQNPTAAPDEEGPGAGKSETQAAKRKLQLESSTAPRGKGVQPVDTGVPDDPAAAWAYFDEQDRKAAAS